MTGLLPATKDDLLIEALRLIDRTSLLLNEVAFNIGERVEGDDDNSFDDVLAMLRRRFSDCSGVGLFIAADNLRVELPSDLRPTPNEESEG